MVMPRSRSMSIRSRYCARALRSSTTPVSWSIRSARVDLPWSMWAMMQKLRMSPGGVAAGTSAVRAKGDTSRFSHDLDRPTAPRGRARVSDRSEPADLHLDEQPRARLPGVDALERGDIGVVPAPGDHDVPVVRRDGIGRVEAGPLPGPPLDPGVTLGRGDL